VYGADLAQLPVVGLVHDPLGERIQSFVQLEGQRGELGVERADHRMQRPDRVAAKLGTDRTCLAQDLKGRARRAAQRDQVSGGAIAVHLDGLAEMLVQAEAHEQGPVWVSLQPRALAELLGVLDRERVQPQPGGELVDDLVGRVLDVQPEGLARPDELRYQRRRRLPDHLARPINPAPHGSRLRHPLLAHRGTYDTQ
jgi:hypothetical protein